MTLSTQPSAGRVTDVVVATSIMLTFISFWRAAAIVLNDLGSSAFYVAGIAEQAVGHAAPWFILGVMLFSYAVRAVYIESCAMFTRGGVYRVVKEAMGGTLAKLSVSALMFDYILTGPISGVSAGQYIVGLIAQTLTSLGHPWAPSRETINLLAAGIAVLITGYFRWRNIRGMHESSSDALRIMYVTTVMVAILIGWSGLTLLLQPETRRLPPAPVPSQLTFNHDAVGWLPALAPQALRALLGAVPPATSPAPEATRAEPRYGLAPQAGTLIGSRGNVYVLGEAYAFGVVWAFALKALAVLVLRFKDRSPREWKVPGNLSLDRFELPVGLGVITALLFAIAGINLLTKEVATVSGVAFTLIFFIIFSISERLSERRRGTAPAEFEQFRLHRRAEVSEQTLGVRPGNLLCTVRDYRNLAHLSHVLERTDTGRQDVLVMTVRVLRGPAAGYHDIHAHELFTIYEQQLFSRVVTLAETAGKHVELLVVPSSNVFQAMAHTAVQLNSAEIIAGRQARVILDCRQRDRSLRQIPPLLHMFPA